MQSFFKWCSKVITNTGVNSCEITCQLFLLEPFLAHNCKKHIHMNRENPNGSLECRDAIDPVDSNSTMTRDKCFN